MKDIERLIEWLRESDDILLLGHVSPDGDASGSTMALKMALEAMGKRAAAYLPGGLAKMYGFLPHSDGFAADVCNAGFEPEAVLAVDVSDEARLGDGLKAFAKAKRRAVLDHHGTNPGFGDVNCIDPGRAATGEMVLEVIEGLGAGLTKDMAEWLYTAISTDCGQFGYSNTTGGTMRAAAKCLDAGADGEHITKMLYKTRTRGRTVLLGRVLSGLHTEMDGRIAWATLTDRMLEEAGATREDNEGVVNYLVEIAGVRAAFLAEERENGTKFSLRSAKGWDIANTVAVPLGGGGHANAAGVTLNMPMDEAIAVVREKIRAAVEE